MTHAKAKIRIWNPKSYSVAEVQEAAIWMLGSFRASKEDIDQASFLL